MNEGNEEESSFYGWDIKTPEKKEEEKRTINKKGYMTCPNCGEIRPNELFLDANEEHYDKGVYICMICIWETIIQYIKSSKNKCREEDVWGLIKELISKKYHNYIEYKTV